MTRDGLVLITLALGAAFVAGIEIGQASAPVQANTTRTACVAQPGEKLAYATQFDDRIVCTYAQFPMRAKKTRPAT